MLPTLFGTSYNKFAHRYAIFGGYQGYQVLKYVNLDELYSKIKMSSFTCITEDVLDLPEYHHKVVNFNLDTEARRLYVEMKKESVIQINGEDISPDNVLATCNKLSQLSSGFIIDNDLVAVNIDDTRIDIFMDVVEEIAPSEPIVVFYRYKMDAHKISSALAKSKISYSFLNGDSNELIDWKEGKTRVLIAQYSSGSEGVDLTRSRYVIYYNHVYSNTLFDQSVMRCRRPNQKSNKVFYIHLIASQTIDGDIYKCLHDKRDIVSYMINVLRGN
jgi:superfamily II DNA or RNA helicase